MSTDKRENVTFAERKEEFERQVQTAQTIAISGRGLHWFLSRTLYLHRGTVSRKRGNIIFRTGTG